jgi:hypothetical protein
MAGLVGQDIEHIEHVQVRILVIKRMSQLMYKQARNALPSQASTGTDS